MLADFVGEPDLNVAGSEAVLLLSGPTGLRAEVRYQVDGLGRPVHDATVDRGRVTAALIYAVLWLVWAWLTRSSRPTQL